MNFKPLPIGIDNFEKLIKKVYKETPTPEVVGVRNSHIRQAFVRIP